MQTKSVSSEKLNEQAKFHSFILFQTKNIPLSEKLPFIVTTQKGKIAKQTLNQETLEDFECNYSFNCVKYSINGKNIILSEGSWIKALLTPKEIHHLQTYQIANFEFLEIKKQARFYFYHPNQISFLEVKPKYLVTPDCLIFEEIDHIKDLNFKNLRLFDVQQVLKRFANDKDNIYSESYTFESDYAIMSDLHFLGSFIRGFKQIGSYVKKKSEKSYFHILDQKLVQNLKRIYPTPNL